MRRWEAHMQRVGWTLLITGVAVLAGYAAYEIVEALLDAEIPWIVPVGIFVAAIGFLLLMVGIIAERMRARQSEHFEKEVEP